MTVAALFVDRDSIYKSIPGVICYDVDRDALSYPGGYPVVAHPPCRLWGRLRSFSTAPIEEKQLAIWSVGQVRKWGGVLEHPAYSKLWSELDLPYPGEGFDGWGGWTMDINQHWFGHRAAKRTWLYIVGVAPGKIPTYSIDLNIVTHVVCSVRNNRPEVSKKERSATPPALARWLVELAEMAIPDSETDN